MNKFFPTCLALLFLLQSLGAQNQITAFAYQGKLSDAGVLANGNYDILLTAHDVISGGTPLGMSQEFPNVGVTNGVFVVYPDFGPDWLTGGPRWIETKVRRSVTSPPASTYTALSPRQPVYAVPMANLALRALNVTIAPGSVTGPALAPGAVGSTALGPAAVGFDALAAGAVRGDRIAIGGVDRINLAANAVSTSQLADGSVTPEKLVPMSVGQGQLAMNSVGNIAIRTGAITADKLAPNSVGGSVILPGAITADKLAPGVGASFGTPSGA